MCIWLGEEGEEGGVYMVRRGGGSPGGRHTKWVGGVKVCHEG